MSHFPIATALRDKTVLVCVGAGGVGKTTIAASLGLRSSVDGRAALVCTIDPARRLATSLGLAELGNTETPIARELFHAAGLVPRAALSAMMLDMKASWDHLIERLTTPEQRARIFSNRVYQSVSSTLAGSQEYIAMEKLRELRLERSYPLIVLDTPPTSHALDFLDAPNRVLDFLDNEAARFLLSPVAAAGKVGFRLFRLSTTRASKVLAKFTGQRTLEELANFIMVMSELNPDFRSKAEEVRALLTNTNTAFVIVASPNLERLDEVVRLHTVLLQNRIAVAAVVANRVHFPVPETAWAEAKAFPAPLRDRLLETLAEHAAAARMDQRGVSYLQRLCLPTPVVEVPRFDLDVHDLTALWKVSRYLVGERITEWATE